MAQRRRPRTVEPEIDAYLAGQTKKELVPSLNWSWVRYSEISPHLKRAVLVAEDINFFSHRGFETTEIRAALRRSIEKRKLPRGASTISQQVTRNLWLSPSRNPWRKVKEALLTHSLEAKLKKRRILEIYLNCAEFGPGIYGAEAASQEYFSKHASQLNNRQAAQLATSLSRSSSSHPGVKSRGFRKNQRGLGEFPDARKRLGMVNRWPQQAAVEVCGCNVRKCATQPTWS